MTSLIAWPVTIPLLVGLVMTRSISALVMTPLPVVPVMTPSMEGLVLILQSSLEIKVITRLQKLVMQNINSSIIEELMEATRSPA